MPMGADEKRQRVMAERSNTAITRRGLLGAFAATALVAAPVYSRAAGYVKGAGDCRFISMYSRRSGEDCKAVYWIDGEYIKDAVDEISLIMRDWRRDEVKDIDLRTIDIMAATHRLLDTSEPFQLLSGYRSAKTNAMLRRRSRSVAKKSLHITGQAADLRLSSRSVRQLARAARSCQAGGVGSYSRSRFVHMDCGPVRTWGR